MLGFFSPAAAKTSITRSEMIALDMICLMAVSMSGLGSEFTAGVIVFKKPKSLGRYDTYTGVVTNQRLIFAQLTNEMISAASRESKEQAKAEGKGFWGQWSDQLKATFGYSKIPNYAARRNPR
jgi:hypothetical protein